MFSKKANENERMREKKKNQKKKLTREKKMAKRYLLLTPQINLSVYTPRGSQAHSHHRGQNFYARAMWFWFIEWLARVKCFGIILIIWVCLSEWGGWFNIVVLRCPRHTYSDFAHTLVIELISSNFVHTLVIELTSIRNIECKKEKKRWG